MRFIKISDTHYKRIDDLAQDGPDNGSEAKIAPDQLVQGVQNVVQDQIWRFRTSRTSDINRSVDVYLTAIGGAVAVIAGILIYVGIDVCVSVYVLLSALGLLIIPDPFKIFRQWIAKQVRVVAAYCIAVCIFLHAGGDPEIGRVLGVIALAGVAICYVRNRYWLEQENWLATSAVTKAKREDMAPESEGSWQGHGMRECRTLLYELGYSQVVDDVLRLYAKPIYLLGHIHGMEREADLEELDDGYADNDLEEQRDYDQEDYDALAEEYDQLVDENNNLRSELGRVRHEKLAAEQRVQELEELLRAQPESKAPEEPAEGMDPFADQLTNAKPSPSEIQQTYDRLKSERKVAEALNISRREVRAGLGKD